MWREGGGVEHVDGEQRVETRQAVIKHHVYRNKNEKLQYVVFATRIRSKVTSNAVSLNVIYGLKARSLQPLTQTIEQLIEQLINELHATHT